MPANSPFATAAASAIQTVHSSFVDPHACCRRSRPAARLVCLSASSRIRMDTNTSCIWKRFNAWVRTQQRHSKQIGRNSLLPRTIWIIHSLNFLRNFNISNYPDDKYGAEDDKLYFVISSCDAWSSSRFVHRHTSSREILKEFLCSNVCSWIHFWCLNNQLIDENWKLVLDSMSVGGSWMSIAMMEQDV